SCSKGVCKHLPAFVGCRRLLNADRSALVCVTLRIVRSRLNELAAPNVGDDVSRVSPALRHVDGPRVELLCQRGNELVEFDWVKCEIWATHAGTHVKAKRLDGLDSLRGIGRS